MNRNSSEASGSITNGNLRGRQRTGAAQQTRGDRTNAQLTGRAMARRVEPHSLVTQRTHPRPRRVLMTADCIGGVWTYALDLARGLCEEGVRVVLATMGDLPSATQRQECEAIPGLTLCASQFKLEWMPGCWPEVEQAGLWLLDLEARFAPDLIHLNGYTHASLNWKAPVLVVAHSCVLSWWRAVKSAPAPPEWQTYREQVTRGVQAAHTVVAPTQAMLNALAAHYGPLPPARVIANARHSALYRPERKEPFILTAGRLWDEAKNTDALRQVAPRLTWPVYAAGCSGCDTQNDPPAPSSQDANFRPLGRLSPDHLAAWYARAAVYALPARYEPFGLSALEAALSGCALVLGDIASLREVWGDAALFAPPDDTEALYRALNRLAANADLRRDMAERARVQAQQYSLRAMTAAYLDCYGAMLPTIHGAQFVHEAMTLVPLDHIDPIEDDELWYQQERQTRRTDKDDTADANDARDREDRKENIADNTEENTEEDSAEERKA